MPKLYEIKQVFFQINTFPDAIPAGAPLLAPTFYQQGDWRVVSRCLGRGERHFGEMAIWYCEEVVWVMYYHGSWQTDDSRWVPFLQEALRLAYADGSFVAGRGLLQFDGAEFTYRNRPRRLDFESFGGEEIIRDRASEEVLYRLDYGGGALI